MWGNDSFCVVRAYHMTANTWKFSTGVLEERNKFPFTPIQLMILWISTMYFPVISLLGWRFPACTFWPLILWVSVMGVRNALILPPSTVIYDDQVSLLLWKVFALKSWSFCLQSAPALSRLCLNTVFSMSLGELVVEMEWICLKTDFLTPFFSGSVYIGWRPEVLAWVCEEAKGAYGWEQPR